MAYNRINWENAPSTATPLDADNLNRMDAKIADLDTSMDAVQEGYDEMSNELDLVNARIDTFTNLPDGSTTGDAELADARLGADGVTYNTLGQAIRTQFTNIKSDAVPTSGSTKTVQSGGTYTAIQNVLTAIAPVFSSSATYAIGDYCVHNNILYRAKSAVPSGNDFITRYWTELGNIAVLVGEMRNIVTDTEVVLGNRYPVGTFLFYDGYLYEAVADNVQFNGAGSGGWHTVRLEDIIARINANFAEQYSNKTYSAGEFCVQEGFLYRARTDITTAEAFDASHWDQVSVTEVLDEAITDLKADLEQLVFNETTTTKTIKQIPNVPSELPTSWNAGQTSYYLSDRVISKGSLIKSVKIGTNVANTGSILFINDENIIVYKKDVSCVTNAWNVFGVNLIATENLRIAVNCRASWIGDYSAEGTTFCEDGSLWTSSQTNVNVGDTMTFTKASSTVKFSLAVQWEIETGGRLADSIEAMSTATASDVGKALKAKAVSDGKVTEWEFGKISKVDQTLTEEGAAADAKATGDALTELESTIFTETGIKTKAEQIPNIPSTLSSFSNTGQVSYYLSDRVIPKGSLIKTVKIGTKVSNDGAIIFVNDNNKVVYKHNATCVADEWNTFDVNLVANENLRIAVNCRASWIGISAADDTAFCTDGSLITSSQTNVNVGDTITFTKASSTMIFSLAVQWEVETYGKISDSVIAIAEELTDLKEELTDLIDLTDKDCWIADDILEVAQENLESGSWVFSNKVANTKVIRYKTLIPVWKGMTFKCINPTYAVIFAVIATKTSTTSLQVVTVAAGNNGTVTVTHDGYMALNISSASDISVSDYDCEISLSKRSKVAIDDNLAIKGAAADAKATGDALAEIESTVHTETSIKTKTELIPNIPSEFPTGWNTGQTLYYLSDRVIAKGSLIKNVKIGTNVANTGSILFINDEDVIVYKKTVSCVTGEWNTFEINLLANENLRIAVNTRCSWLMGSGVTEDSAFATNGLWTSSQTNVEVGNTITFTQGSQTLFKFAIQWEVDIYGKISDSILTVKEKRPASGYHNFSVSVNYSDYTVNSSDGESLYTDYGVIALPTNYSATGAPTKLIILCGGSGERIGPNTDPLTFQGWEYCLAKGYAVMDINGVSTAWASAKGVPNTGLHYCNKYLLLSYLSGYRYVMKKYNLEERVFVAGISMGGGAAALITQTNIIPVIANALFCPALSVYKQDYMSAWGGENQKITIAGQWDFPDWSTTTPSQAYFLENIDKIKGFDNLLIRTIGDHDTANANFGNEAEATAYNSMQKIYPVPVKIWHCTDDALVPFRYSQFMVNMIKNGGGQAWLHSFTTGGHVGGWDYGSVSDTDIDGNAVTTSVPFYEAILFFKRFS